MGTVSSRSSPFKRHVKRLARRACVRGSQLLRTKTSGGLVSGLRILTYHRVAEDRHDPFCLRPAAFARQMELLSSTGAVRSLDGALQDLEDGKDLRPAIAITFDDGTEDFLPAVLPVLIRFRLPAVLYVSPACVGSAGFLGWSELSEAARAGVVLGSHGLDHRSLGRASSEEALRQVVESKRVLEDRLGMEVCTLAYPFGTLRDFNEEVKGSIKAAGYRAACTSLNGMNRHETDRFELRRTKLEQGDDPVFHEILEGHLDGWFIVDRYFSILQNRYA